MITCVLVVPMTSATWSKSNDTAGLSSIDSLGRDDSGITGLTMLVVWLIGVPRITNGVRYARSAKSIINAFF